MEWKEKIEEAAKEVMKEIKRMGIPYKDCKEEMFEEALVHEFRLRKIPYERQRNIEIKYKGFTVGMRRPDCIINPGKKDEFLVEIKAVSKIEKKYRMQCEVYLVSLNIEKGYVLNFNTSKEAIEIEEIKKPDRKWKEEISLPKKKSREVTKKVLREAGKEVMDYLGPEFQYYDKEGKEIYVNAVGVELRIKGINFYSATYPILYKGQEITDYSYDYKFEDGSTASIFVYNSQKDIKEKLEKLKIYNKLFGIKKGYILALPSKEEMEVEVREV